jgi:ATP-dependent RNA helicase RhlB
LKNLINIFRKKRQKNSKAEKPSEEDSKKVEVKENPKPASAPRPKTHPGDKKRYHSHPHKPKPGNRNNDKTKQETKKHESKNIRPKKEVHHPKPKYHKKPQHKKIPEHDKWDRSSFQVPVEDGKKRFHDFNLPDEILHAIADLNFRYCTPIQQEILQAALSGKDATGQAQTGTGKTAAFLITIFNKILLDPKNGVRRPGAPRALILAPTRELVMQIRDDAHSLSKYTNLKIAEAFGGMDYNKQRNRLRRGVVDVLVATPGRLLDFQNKRDVFLGSVEILVIDEADRMLDMGFIPDVRKIVHSTPPKVKRQTLFFSATLNNTVRRLASQWTKDAVNVEITPEKTESESVEQIVYIVSNDEKFSLLYNIITKQKLERVIVFANRRDETKKLEEILTRNGISCKILSGDIDQRVRIKTLNNFKAGEIKVLVATDVAGRGLHVESVSHVINYTLPEDPEDYVHRIGRTGRAGASGISISFASEDDSFQIPAIEKFLGHKLECIHPPDDLVTPIPDK